ncbi:cilia- and flagella-associated protein 53 isoform X2 [Haemorhous mexicanus]|uniref:cilia- and flagella-associated protein 53 isoform X2 n=1 Tax=Haemorhous mexicanus TaxID=30427 RepID=UPI0028BEC4ED|nr:cilia- and flagella-associated protein 53 isoform X2 [Haemorhous mexicanus]
MAARPPPRPQSPRRSHTQRRREFTGCGPLPGEVALLAKPTKRDLVEETILAERALEEEQREQERDLRVFHHYRNVCEWHKGGEDKWMQRAAERKVRATLQQYLQEIEVRRQRLRDFLEAEESRHLAEVNALDEEKAQQREVKMKEQAKLLREKREQERLQVVAEKREQQFRNRCHEYREHCKKLNEKELSDCQLAQQTLKEILKKEEKMQERKLEEICEKEQLAKDQEAELRAQEAAARIREMEKELHQLRKETEDLERKKRYQQKECREMWLKAVQDRQKHLDAEKQIQLAEEKVILENDFDNTDKEYEKIRNKKQTLLKEQLTYLDHLAEQLRREKEQEREDEKIFKEERDKVWAERVEKLKQEREARFHLLRDVMNTRQMQMEEKLQKKEERKIEIAEERKAMAELVRKFEYEEEEERIRKARKAKEYRDQLTTQIAYQQWLQKAEEEKRKKEEESNMEAERQYQEKIQFILSMPNK